MATAALVVTVGLVLSGCVATAGNIAVRAAVSARAATADKNKPKVGECWQGTFKDADGYANWGDSPAVKCSEPHQLYTYDVWTLKSLHKGKLFDKKNLAYTAIVNDAYNTCVSAEELDLPALDYTDARIYIEDFLPEEQQWDAGARWVRCDVTVLALGKSVDKPEFATLPAWSELKKAMRHDPTEFDYCVNIPSGANVDDPKSSSAVYANCDENPKWALKDYIDIDAGPDDSYPSPSDLAAQYQQNCESVYTNAQHLTYASYPSKKDWADGYTQFECWAGRK